VLIRRRVCRADADFAARAAGVYDIVDLDGLDGIHYIREFAREFDRGRVR
jgi:nitrogenase molybdenum-iron protein alpha/beta subunit